MIEDDILEVNNLLAKKGLTLATYVQVLGKQNSTILNLSKENQVKFNQLYDEVFYNKFAKKEKGQKLEELISILFCNSSGSFFDCKRNCRTSSNEIDLFLTWNEKARITGINSAFPCFGDSFLCECKNYQGKVGVTYIGKFYSLLSLANAKLGIIVAWDGITGKGMWDASKGLIKKIALKDGIFIIDINQHDLIKIYDCKCNVYSLILDKYTSLQNDIDFTKYVSRHPVEEMIGE